MDAISENEDKSMIECICYEETHDKFDKIIKENGFFKIYNSDIVNANKTHT